MHINVVWDGKHSLLIATERIEGRLRTLSSGNQGAYDRQKIQMGMRKGNTVLRGMILYQSVLIMMEAKLKLGKAVWRCLSFGKKTILYILCIIQWCSSIYYFEDTKSAQGTESHFLGS